MKRILALRGDPTVQRFARFLIVGLVNTLFGYALYAALILFGTIPQIALFVSFCVGVLWNYVTTARFVFQVSGFSRLPAYVACYVAVYASNALALYLATGSGISPLVAQAILTPLAAILSFVLLSRVMQLDTD